MGFLKEFKAFAMRGNVVDMAVGIIIGGAFGKIVSSFVSDVVMPPIGILLGNVDFKELMFVMKPATETTAAVAIRYGMFISTVIDFLIIALAIFMAIKVMNRMRRKEEAAPSEPAKPSEEVVLLTEIRDSLNKK
ncbi:MAG: large-conductance mechanosensitive channel protein MscL [archaeon]